MNKTIEQMNNALSSIEAKSRSGDDLNDQDLMVLLLASLTEEEHNDSKSPK